MSAGNDVMKVGFYCFGKTIGKGNSSIVKHAVHAIVKSEVAVKIIDKSLFEKDSSLEKVKREIDALKNLRHPNIIKLYQVMESEKLIYLISEYIPNGEIFEYIANHGKFSEKEAKIKFAQIVNAVDYCHQNGIVHRDLKAENLLLDADLNVKLADFGFCNKYSKDSKLSTWCGSPPYAAPEIFEGQSYVGPEVDIWSLGVILYVLVCGMLPFDGDNLKMVKERVVSGRFRIPFFMSTDCEKLLRNILVVDSRKRCSMSYIKNHIWLRDAIEELGDLEESLRDQLVVTGRGVSLNCHDMVLERLQEAKIDKERVLQSLKNNCYDNFYAIYELLLDKIARHIKKYPQSRLSAAGLRRPSMISEQVMLSRKVKNLDEKENNGNNQNNAIDKKENDSENDNASDVSNDMENKNELKASTKLIQTKEAVFSQTTDGVSLHEVAGPLCQLQQRVRCQGGQDDAVKELNNPSGGAGVMIMPTSPIRPKLTRSPRIEMASRRKKMLAESSIDEGVETEEDRPFSLHLPQRPPCHPCNSIDSNIDVDTSVSSVFGHLEKLFTKDELPCDLISAMPHPNDFNNFRKGRRASDGLMMKLDSLAAQKLFLKNRACGIAELRKELMKLQNQTVQQLHLSQLKQNLHLSHNTRQQSHESQEIEKIKKQNDFSKEQKPLINNSYLINKLQMSLEEQQNTHQKTTQSFNSHRAYRKQPYNKIHCSLEHQARPVSPIKGSSKRQGCLMRPLPFHSSHRCPSPSFYTDSCLSSASTSPIRSTLLSSFSPTFSSATFKQGISQAYYNSNLDSFPPSVCQSGGNILNNNSLGSLQKKPKQHPVSIFPIHIASKHHHPSQCYNRYKRGEAKENEALRNVFAHTSKSKSVEHKSSYDSNNQLIMQSESLEQEDYKNNEIDLQHLLQEHLSQDNQQEEKQIIKQQSSPEDMVLSTGDSPT